MNNELHITQCLHPIRVRNRFTNEMVTVSCGKCPACLSSRSFKMQERLNMERQSWKYCVFTTLTYSNEHLPILKKQGDFLTDLSAGRVHPIVGVKSVDLNEELHSIHRANSKDIDDTRKLIDLFSVKFGGVPYLSSVDIQRFIKRLRIGIYRKFKLQTSYPNEKNTPSIRYFAAGEYGPSTFRPHYHALLFFNSEWLASYITEFIRENWKFGLTDTSFVSKCNSAYVAGYISSFSNLPALYQVRSLRPFALFSKHPALGTLIYNSETLKSQFLSCDVSQCLIDTTLKLPINVPLWRTLQDSLYPKLPYFSELSVEHRTKLYSILQSDAYQQSFGNFNSFVSIVERSPSEYCKTYIDRLKSADGDYINKLYRWFSVCKRVTLQSEIFEISPKDYINTIFQFYDSSEYAKLKLLYDFEEHYSKEHDVIQLFGIDGQFYESIRLCLLAGYSFEDLDATEQLYLKQFEKLDFTLLFHDDLSVRSKYLDELKFEESYEYKYVKSNKLRIYENSSKTKKKNDYLLSQTDDFYKLIQNF